MQYDFAQARRIFEEACELAEDARRDFVARRCGNDSALRDAVMALLAGDRAAADRSLLRGSPRSAADALLSDLDDPLASITGELVIGEFRVDRRLASGGMGVVYLAEQRSPKRTVALKVLKPAFCSGSTLRRFAVESEILGRLQHPGIARVFGAGVHGFEFGSLRFDLPWYAMEFVADARSITEHVRGEKLATRDRFAIFVRVCDAVAHAHAMGVIHRDLKPGNVLVDREGNPKIIDFGIARAIDSAAQIGTMQTRTGELIGTLRYMSPEQLDGDPSRVDVRSDVYALGAILYELLTDRPAHVIDGRPFTEALRIVREQEPTAPSRIDAKLRGEPEWIVWKALERDPTRRYASVAALRDDCERLLANEALEAGPPSGFYRARKFVARHRALVAATTLVVAALTGGLISTLRALDRALVAESKAQDEATVSNQVVSLFQRTFESARNQERGRDLRVVDALDEVARNATTVLDDRPYVAARLVSRVAELYYSLGDEKNCHAYWEKTLEFLDRAGVVGTDEDLLLRTKALELRSRVGDFAGAEALLAQLQRLAAERYPPDHELRLDLRFREALTLWRKGEPKKLEAVVLALIPDLERVQGKDGRGVLDAKNLLSIALQDQGRLDEAEPIARDLVDAMTRTLGADSTQTLDAMGNLAGLLLTRGSANAPEAKRLFETVLDGYERTIGLDNVSAIGTRSNLAMTKYRLGEIDAAIADFDEAIRRGRAVLGPTNPQFLNVVIAASRVETRQGRAESALARLDDALASIGDSLPEDSTTVQQLRGTRGRALHDLGRTDEARVELRRAYEVLRKNLGESSGETLQILKYLKDLDPD